MICMMVDKPWGVAAYGTASVRAKPNLVRVRFKVSRTEQGPSEAFAATSEVVSAARRVLRAHGVPDAAVEQSHLDLRSSWAYGTAREFLGHECEASFAVESGALEDVQPLLVDLVAAGANEIGGVEFDVSGKGELRAEARREAVRAARRKAELYAEAAGVRLGAVLHIEDVDPDVAGEGAHRGYESGVSSEDLAPGHVTVTAAVILGFSITRD